ncbi:MAG: 5-formyltetrahydrofolate cyclo-ligase [Candidatus Omnitrophica bacterium]|nr:5-formyltetrahydrofolate cyclo-ligase [Candidatus Omnitrophota bacterium]
MMTKAQWRMQVCARVGAMTGRQRLAASRRLAARLRRLPAYRAARWVAFYLATDGEVETRAMIRQALADGKRVAAPIPVVAARTIRLAELTGARRGLTRGPFGIEQPHPGRARRVRPDALDLIVVPGVAFDRLGYRLGRGAGYYDRFLATLPPGIPRVGLAFRCQRVARLPRQRHDQPVTTVLAA